MNYGIDFLGGARYQKTVLQNHPRSWGFGVFAEVDGFGKAYQLIDQVAALGVPFIRVQMIWKDDHKFGANELKVLEQRCKLLKPILLKHPSVKFYVSPCCEHELNEAAWNKFAGVVINILGGLCQLVNSPNYKKGFVSREYINEYHHEEKPRSGGKYAFSFDGANCVDSDVEKYKANYKDAVYFMFWNSQCNGRRNLEDKTPRAQRKFWPTAKQIDSWIWLHRVKGATQMRKSDLLKSHSDQHTVPPSGKDQKPVFIIPEKAKELVLKADNGQTIDTARYFGTFTGGGHRYYCTQWGFDLAQKALRIHGKPTANLFLNGKRIGVVNCAFREGKFR